MIKFLADFDGRPMIGVGLSRENCDKLLLGKPIFIDLKLMLSEAKQKHDFNEAWIFVFAGETEQIMMKQMKVPKELIKQAHKHDEENND